MEKEIIKLMHVTNDICSIAPHDIQRKENILFAENKVWADIILVKRKEYVSVGDNLYQSG